MQSTVETCENCGRMIGRLETPHLYGEHVVCTTCHGHLSVPHPPHSAAPRPPADESAAFEAALHELASGGGTEPDPPPVPAEPVPYWSAGMPGHPPAAYAPAAPVPVNYATPYRPKYVDKLWGVRLICLIASLVFWPLLVVWLALGVYHLIMKSRG